LASKGEVINKLHKILTSLYSRRNLILTLPIREIQHADGMQDFVNEIQPVNNIDLSYLIDKNIGKRYILVYELHSKILGFITFLDYETYFHLDLVEANRLHDESKKVKPGLSLILFLIKLAKGFNHEKITLHSTENNVDYYTRLGFQITGKSELHAQYGNLTPMKKLL